jgi:hypothetical protein
MVCQKVRGARRAGKAEQGKGGSTHHLVPQLRQFSRVEFIPLAHADVIGKDCVVVGSEAEHAPEHV